jgi:hypothetical protein
VSNIQVRLYEKGDEYKIVELLKLVFKGWPQFDLNCTPLEHWRWKYEDNPTKILATIVATMNDEIIGHSGSLFNKCKIGEKILLCEQGSDFAVNENYRGQNISSRMFDFKYDYVKETIKSNLRFHVTSNPIMIKRDAQRGFPRFPSPIIHYMRIEDIKLHLEEKNSKNKSLNQFGFRVLNYLNKLAKTKSPMKNSENESNFEIKKINVFDRRVDRLWDNVKNNYCFMLEKKKEYLNWRYCDIRAGDYIINQAENGEEVLGFVVLRIKKNTNNYLEGNIVDLVTPLNRIDVTDSLISSAISLFDSRSINTINAWTIKGHPYDKLLANNSFIDINANSSGCFEHFNYVENPSEIINCPAEKFHFQMGDSDWI